METPTSNICCVYGCRARITDDRLSFFPLPAYSDKRAKLLKAIGLKYIERGGGTKDVLCSRHFGEAIAELVAEKRMLNGMPNKCLPASLRFVDKAVQTDISLENPTPDNDVTVELYCDEMKENYLEIPELSTSMIDLPVKRKRGVEIGESSKKMKN